MSIDQTEVLDSGPLGAFSIVYANELARQGYAPASVRMQLKVLADLSNWLLHQGMVASDLKAVEVDRFLCCRRDAGHTRYVSTKSVRPILDYLRRLEIVPPEAEEHDGPVEMILCRYWRFLTVERSLAPVTARCYVGMVRSFLERRLSVDGVALDLGHLTAADVASFVVARCPRQSRGAAKLTVTALRSLLGFLHLDGIIERSLVSAVPSVAGRRLVGLPKGLDSDQVRRLLASCDGRTRRGCRDLAILTMLVRLGMRSGEVAKLRFDDIDWRAGEMVVRGKANCMERLPLPQDVGDSLAVYLQRGRPASAQGRTVFVRIKAPHRHLSSAGVSNVVAEAAQRADLGQIRAHRLRHTVAMQMLRGGASLPEIGQLLRHRRALTTAIYAKVDRDALRRIARPWPGDAP
ncbi:site-specific integrase [Acidiphilium sp. AL]|uniref:site-specific integrase n=1 Tax=Acidiphilium sp. AL TaxID=2871704 RepID=UPI0021CB722D|nr:site-specific integrase [Acidiphilium sp. AL]MCU4162311.1 site-specific integrase [Acidiphilium sp. AL]